MKKWIFVVFILMMISGYGQRTVTIGSQVWMADNLDIGQKISVLTQQTNNGQIEKWCYNDLEANCEKFGGWYQWGEAMEYLSLEGSRGICPEGFHIPTYDEWMILAQTCGGMENAGKALNELSPLYWRQLIGRDVYRSDNSTGFTARGGGYIYKTRSLNQLYYAYFWSSSIRPYSMVYGYEQYYNIPGQFQVAFVTCYSNPAAGFMMRPPTDAFQVRCIKD